MLELDFNQSEYGGNGQEIEALRSRLSRELEILLEQGVRPKILLNQPDPAKFIVSFRTAVGRNRELFLANPNWQELEWQQVLELVQPDLIWGEQTEVAFKGVSPPSSTAPEPRQLAWIMIPTGGSSGQIRFAIHTWETLAAAVEGFQHHFGIAVTNSLCTLPLYHVSGLMQYLRAYTSGGKLIIQPYKTLVSQLELGLPPAIAANFFLSLVPTQLQQLIQIPGAVKWLRQFEAVFLGGGPAWEELLFQAQQAQIPLALTYGMTETAAQIATLKPEAFLRGETSCGQPLPHVQVQILDPAGQGLDQGAIGGISIQTNSLALGYYPNPFFESKGFLTDDLGYLDSQGNLHIVGRSSTKIITGGENVFPAEVEAAIRETGLVKDVCVLGIPDDLQPAPGDRQWGEIVTAVYVPVQENVSVSELQTALQGKLSKFKQPKRWLAVANLGRNPQGKVNTEQLRRLILGDQ